MSNINKLPEIFGSSNLNNQFSKVEKAIHDDGVVIITNRSKEVMGGILPALLRNERVLKVINEEMKKIKRKKKGQ